MARVLIVMEVEQAEGATPLPPVELGESCGRMLEAGGLTVHSGKVIVQQSLADDMPGVFSKPAGEGEGQEKPHVPYQSKATLGTSIGGQYMDVIGDEGRVLCSFEKPDVRRVWMEMNR